MINHKVVHLDISSWRGISIGAVHFYGKLIWDDKTEKYSVGTLELKRPMTAKEALLRNKADEKRIIKPGVSTYQFNTEADVLRYGIKAFNQKFKDSLLMLGGFATASATHKLYLWPKTFDEQAQRMNDLVDQRTKLNGYKHPKNETKVCKIDDEWYSLLLGFDKNVYER
jgi:hypothetical protein